MATVKESAPPIDEFRETVEAVFQYMLDLPLTLDEAASPSDHEQMQGTVQLAGDWTGRVIIRCGAETARAFAARFLSAGENELEEPLVLDVLGEMANIIAGNLKYVLGAHIKLSDARATVQREDFLLPKDARVQGWIQFQCAAGPFCVVLLADPTLRAPSYDDRRERPPDPILP